jgi:hypothetical protein
MVNSIAPDGLYSFGRYYHTIKTISSSEGKDREGGLNRHRVRSGLVLHTSICNCINGNLFQFGSAATSD